MLFSKGGTELMAKRPNPRALKANRTYTIPELALSLDVSVGCVRGWVRDGLSAMISKRPYLILGSDARAFLERRRNNATTSLQPDQFFCMSCKAPRRPWGMLVDLFDQPGGTVRVMGLCEECHTPCNRMVGRAKIPRLDDFFDVTRRVGTTP